MLPLETIGVIKIFALGVSTLNVAVVDYVLLRWRLRKSESAGQNHQDRI